MATTIKAKIYSDAEIEVLERQSIRRILGEPRITDANFDANSGQFVFTLHNGSQATVTARSLPGLESGTNEQLADIRLVSLGSGIHWPRLDEQYSAIGLLELIFGVKTVHSMVTKGGRAKSEAKSNASRANGAKGGRPKVVRAV